MVSQKRRAKPGLCPGVGHRLSHSPMPLSALVSHPTTKELGLEGFRETPVCRVEDEDQTLTGSPEPTSHHQSWCARQVTADRSEVEG